MKKLFGIVIIYLFFVVGCISNEPSRRSSSVPYTPKPILNVERNQDIGGHIHTRNTSDFSMEEVQKWVDLHNKVRADVGVGPVSWSNEIATVAQTWANQLEKIGCQMQHSQSRYGENLFMGWGGYHDIKDAIKSWESEKRYYHGQVLSGSNWHASGHYTQMVWRNTQQIGCGKAVCSNKTIFVCNYNPPGNFMGKKPY